MTLPAIQPKATMEEAWAERARQRAEGDRLRDEGQRLLAVADWVVILTAHSLYGTDCHIDWRKRTVTPATKGKG